MTEAALAEVGLIIVSKGAGKQIEREIDREEGPGEKVGKSIGAKMLGGIGGAMKVGAVAVGVAAVGALGTAVVKGFNRLDGLDQANAKLLGLGHSGETVRVIMDNALASVKGTAFGMAEAGTAAANAVAAGVKPGQDLERTLKLIADASTIAGTDMGTMGAIFNKAAASNKVQMDVINQLHDAGVPALALLANQMGVTAEEASKMASKGKIDFATFQDAIQKGMGGAAADSGATFSGALDNVGAAMGRLGADLLGGIFPEMKNGFGDMTAMLDDLGPVAKDVGKAIGDFAKDALPKLAQGAKAAADAIGGFFGWINDNRDVLGPIAVAVAAGAAAFGVWQLAIATWTAVTNLAKAAMVAFNVVMNANPIMLIVTAVVTLVAGLVWFFTQTDAGRAIWAAFTKFLGDAWKNVAGFLTDSFANVGKFFETVWTSITGFFTAAYENVIRPVVEKIGEIFQWIYNTIIMPVVTGIMIYIGLWAAIITWLWEQVVQPALVKVGELFTWLYEVAIKPAIEKIGEVITWLWENVFKPAFDGIGIAVQAVGNFFTWLWVAAIQPAINAVGVAVQWVYNSVIVPVFAGIRAAVEAVGAAFTWLYSNVVKPVFDSLAAAFTWVYETVVKPVAGFISDTITGIGSTVEKVFGAIAGFMEKAFTAAAAVIKKPINAIIGLVNGAIDGINSLSVTIPDWVPMVGGQTFGVNIPRIPQLAAGGVVSKRPGGILANIGEGRHDEAVVPLDQKFYDALSGGSGGDTYQINVNGAELTADQVVEAIRREIRYELKGA